MTLVEALRLIADIVSWTVLIAVTAGLLARDYVADWLRGRVRAAVDRENARYKADLDLELETYKTNMIRQLDEARLALDMRRAVALKMATTKLDALQRLSVALYDFTTFAAGMAQTPMPQRKASASGFAERQTTLLRLRLEANLFLGHQVGSEIADLMIEGSKVAWESPDVAPNTQGNADLRAAYNSRAARASIALRKEYERIARTGEALEPELQQGAP